MTCRIHNIPNPSSQRIPLLGQLGRTRRQLANTLIDFRLFGKELGSVAFGLFDGADFFLEGVDFASGGFGFVLSCTD